MPQGEGAAGKARDCQRLTRGSVVPQPPPRLSHSSRPLLPQLQSGIGRLILKEEMRARSSSYADPWAPPRSSTSSREALHTAGCELSLNGCKLRLGSGRGWAGGRLLPHPFCPKSHQRLEGRLGEGLYWAPGKALLCPEPPCRCPVSPEAMTPSQVPGKEKPLLMV